ncbi:MFS transporter [Arsenophonus endosymbiont of Bemisia tabaci]|uniref:MFS transporter n=1 Tax=Arsenophonus endosymbiont of Bemisia tabaci TaxID=536059 RepID=UPI0015F47CA4|nr:MFS transporter [Arsenophonus endosymbiont of Bemisia tabaci]CAA2929430.1 Methyl viologen resistance protein SmvA [Arsenophonus endosymbiont of Bemisia tabaci Q2]
MVNTHDNRRWIALLLISSALFLIVIDMTVLYIALPTLTHELHANASEKLWIINAYPLVVAGLLPAAGMLSDRIGHKKMLISGLPLFALASFCAAFSPNPESLIAARVFLAVGAAMMMPATLSIVRHIFTEPQERSLAIGIWSAVAAGGAAVGPLVGGLLLKYFWWGSVFLINVPVVMLVLPFSVSLIPSCGGTNKRAIVFLGSLLILVGLVGLIYALKELSKPNFSLVEFCAAALIGVIFMLFFVLRQRKQSQPIIDFSLFSNRLFSAGVIIAVITMSVIVGIELVLSQRLQLVLGFKPLQAAFCILPIPIGSVVASPLTGLLLPRFGERLTTVVSFILTLVGVIGMILFYQSGITLLLINLFIIGMGMGMAFTSASTTIMLNAPDEKSGMAASIEDFAYQLGSVLGVTILGGMMTAIYSYTLFVPEQLTIDARVYDSIDEALSTASTMDKDQAQILIMAASKAFDTSFIVVFITIVCILLVSTVILQRMLRPLIKKS